MRHFLVLVPYLLYAFRTVLSVNVSPEYHERLHLQPLPASSLLASFNFRSTEPSSAFEAQNYRLFPRSLAQILQHASTRELHLRFTLGRWDAESWGARPWNGAKEGGTGVELWAWVNADDDEQADAHWTTLTNALSGLFCASLNFIDSTRTIRPVMSFQPTGHHHNSTIPRLHLLHGTLPREPVCTENLTPFLKLLPCKGKAGISTLLDGHRLFDASWQSMSIDVRPVCRTDDGSECMLEIDQTVDMVLDIERAKRQLGNPIPKPVPVEELVCDTSKPYASDDTCYPLDHTSEPSWSLTEVFGRRIKGGCPLTRNEGEAAQTVCISVPQERGVYVSVGSVEHKDEDGLRCYQLSANDDFDLVLPKQTISSPILLSQPPLYVERSFTGYGQERGGVRTIFKNPSSNEAVEFVYLECLPWFMRTYLHTLVTTINAAENTSRPSTLAVSVKASQRQKNDEKVIRELYYRPALDRRRPTHLEILMRVPANASVVLTYDFEKAILRYTEYPPDANRGFDIPPAIVRLVPSSLSSTNHTTTSRRAPSMTSKGKDYTDQIFRVNDVGGSIGPVYLRTTTLLLYLPTPDFSMPYNVIILTSTVMALAFGSVFNLLVRRFVAADEIDGYGDFWGKVKVVRVKLITWFRHLLYRRRRRCDPDESPDEDQDGEGDGSTEGAWWHSWLGGLFPPLENKDIKSKETKKNI